jgi:hypothetical protein
LWAQPPLQALRDSKLALASRGTGNRYHSEAPEIVRRQKRIEWHNEN